MNLNWTEATRSLTKCQLGLMLALVSLTPSPAQAGLDEKSKVLAEWLVNFTIETLPDPSRPSSRDSLRGRQLLAARAHPPLPWGSRSADALDRRFRGG